MMKDLLLTHRFLFLILVLGAVGSRAFVAPSSTTTTRRSAVSDRFVTTTATTTTTTQLHVFGNGKKPSKPAAVAKSKTKEPVQQKIDPLQLFIVYMTPWRNPNSISVYLMGGLYVLGKISEARHAAGQ